AVLRCNVTVTSLAVWDRLPLKMNGRGCAVAAAKSLKLMAVLLWISVYVPLFGRKVDGATTSREPNPKFTGPVAEIAGAAAEFLFNATCTTPAWPTARLVIWAEAVFSTPPVPPCER